jgi:hypothetical protein
MAMYLTYHASSRFLLKNSPRTAMSARLEIESTHRPLPDYYPGGSAQMTRVAESDDPVLGQFLDFLAEDMAAHPAQLQALDDGLQARIIALLGPMEVDLEAPLATDDE